MGKTSLPPLPPGSFHCSFQGCNNNYSSKKALFTHLSEQHGTSSSRQMSFHCPYCSLTITGKGKFDKHVSQTGDCSVIRLSKTHQAPVFNDAQFDFRDDVMRGVSNGDLTILPIVTGSKTFELTVVPSKERSKLKLSMEQTMIQKWISCWLKARSRGDKEISVNEMMLTAMENAYESQVYSEESIKILKSHCSEAGRQRFLRNHNAFINPLRVTMPRGEPAYVFPFVSSLLRELEKPDILPLLQFDNFPPLLESLQAPGGISTIFPLLHVDDITLTNPLGSKKKKHSIRIFQWQLFNLPPWYRSKLEAKHPLAIAHASSFKSHPEQAWRKILDDFIQSLKKYSNGGLFVPSLNQNIAVRLGSLLGDGLGMFEILGLSMSFSSHASNICFRCEIGGGKKLNAQCQPPEFVRTRQKILADCQKLYLAPNVKIRSTDRTRKELEQKYGIHFKCPFFELDYVSK